MMADEPGGRIWHLPGLELDGTPPETAGIAIPDASDLDWHETTTASGHQVRAPRLSDRQASLVAESVRVAALQARSVRTYPEVLRAISSAALRLSDPSDRVGREAELLLSGELGWSSEAAREALAGMSREWTEHALGALVESEIGNSSLLEHFVPDPTRTDRLRIAVGPPLLFQVHAGNVPGVPVTGAILALLARSGVLAKTAAEEPGLLPLFARALAELDPLLASSVAVTWWPGEDSPPAFARWSKEAGKVFVYGGDSTVRAVRRQIPPEVELIVYGPRVGLAVFLPDAPVEAAALLARDVCAYEQRGCVSPRIAFVIGSDPLVISDLVAAGMEAEAARVPPAAVTEAEAVALRSARAECEFAGLDDGSTRVSGPSDLSWTVLAHRDPGVDSVALPRAVWVYGISSIESLETLLGPFEGRIQSLGYAGHEGEGDLARLAVRLGASRICALGEMAWPPPDWRHEGRHRLLPLLTWTDWEPGP
jgi:hypothetical protein